MHPGQAATACPACGGPAAAEGNCRRCGSPLLAPERRVVTLLFADLAGYTRLSSELDVEQVFLLVRPLMNALRGVCHELGGVVPVIEGDGFMAVFGAQTAQEDDPARAVFAATEMQRLVEERRRAHPGLLGGLRVGLNTGEVLVAGSWEATGFSVSGDPVNVASRLSAVADEGGVLAGATLTALVAAEGRWGPEHEVLVRNRDVPVRCRALDWRGLTGRAVGRRALSTLGYVPRALDRTLRDACESFGVLHVVGEPGVGKTRALTELATQVDGLLSVRAPSFLGPSVRSQLAGLLLDRADSALPLSVHRGLRCAAGRTVDSLEADTDDAMDEAVVAALRALGPVLIAVDDAHACSESDWRLVTRLAEPGLPVALLVVSRSDDALPLDAARVLLTPFDDAAAAQLLRQLLPGADDRLVRVLVGRSGGNPLLLEQAAQMLLDDGVVELTPSGCVVRERHRLDAVPVGMHLFISSRLDLLPERARGLLLLAAVVGDPVEVDLLAHLDGRRDDLGDTLEVLVERGLLRWSSPGRLFFKHQVVRDVAYDRLLRSRRTELHRAAAEWYAVLPVAGVLASEALHLEAAVTLGEPDCELVRRAVRVLGGWALSTLDENTSGSLEVLDRADDLARQHPECAVDTLPLLVTRSMALARLSVPEAAAVGDEAVRRAEDRDDRALLAQALLARAHAARGLEDDEGMHQRAAAALVEVGDEAGLAQLRLMRAIVHVGDGLGPLIAAAEQAHRVAVRTGDDRLAVTAAVELAMHLPARSPAEARRWRGVAEGRLRADDVVVPAKMRFVDAFVESLTYEPVRLVDSARSLSSAALQAGLPQYQDFGTFFELEALTSLGRLDEADLVAGRAQQAAEARPFPNVLVNAWMLTAVLRARQARFEEAEEALAQARAAAGEAPYYESGLLEVEGVTLLERGQFSAAADLLSRSHDLDVDLEQPAFGLRLSLRRLVAVLTAGRKLPMAELQALRVTARDIGAPAVAALAARWLEHDELLRAPHPHDLDLPEAPDLAEARALDFEIAVLLGGDPDGLLDAAREWSSLGTVVWTARALVWHSAITGVEHPEAHELLAQLRAPDGLASRFAVQVARLA